MEFILSEEVLDERNFHCFAVRFFCRELLTNNILYPIINLFDGYNVNYGIVSVYLYLQDLSKDATATRSQIDTKNNENEEKKETLENMDEVKDDSNNMISMQDLHKTITPMKLEIPERDDDDEQNAKKPESNPETVDINTENPAEISLQTMTMPVSEKQDEHEHEQDEGKDDEKISQNSCTTTQRKDEPKSKPLRRRKRRASMDGHLLDHYSKSFNLSHFFIEIHDGNDPELELLKLEPFEQKNGYTISCKYDLDSQYKFTLRFVSAQCINLCARWVTLIDDCQILGDLPSLKHLERIEYNNNKYIYIWNDYKLHEDGNCYLQLGRQCIISNDIQHNNKYYKLRHIFIPLDLPLLHIYFTANSRSPSKDVVKAHKHNISASQSISDGLTKIGNALNPINVINNINDGIKQILPDNIKDKDKDKDNVPGLSIFSSPPNVRISPGGTRKRSLFGMKTKTKTKPKTKSKSQTHQFHHDIDDIGFMPSKNSKSSKEGAGNNRSRRGKSEKKDENKLRILAQHKPTKDLTIRIWDVYRDFDLKMSPYVAYVLRIRDEINIDNKKQRFEWTIRTRFKKLHSFYRALQRDKILKTKNIKIVATFPPKTMIAKMDAKAIAERKNN